MNHSKNYILWASADNFALPVMTVQWSEDHPWRKDGIAGVMWLIDSWLGGTVMASPPPPLLHPPPFPPPHPPFPQPRFVARVAEMGFP